ncbi:MAG: hypothetical protein QOK45_3107 [Mycobacterium sp.]|jgi:NAD(P)-dependent dehydrogenase (short-subunit alcohol dehydrogenase family)|nr:hypothetical protein [Mycobacterium sp.]
MDLTGRTAIVTGAASGIGRACAERLAADGAAVLCADLNDASPTRDKIAAAGGAALATTLDVRDAAAWTKAVGLALDAFDGVHILVNVAGAWLQDPENTPDTVEGITEEHWDWIIGTNLTGTWRGMRAVIPHMRAVGGGRIVNFSSLAALRGLKNMAAYSASKGGIQSLTIQAAADLADDGILVNAIAPGAILTPSMEKWPDQVIEQMRAPHLIPRIGQPTDIAGMVAYLVGEGSFMTGQTIPVDGGWTARGAF